MQAYTWCSMIPSKHAVGGQPAVPQSWLRRTTSFLHIGFSAVHRQQWQKDGGPPVVRHWPATAGPTLLVHQWTTSSQPLWSNTVGPLVGQQWQLMPPVDRWKTNEQNSSGPLVAATGGPLTAMFTGINHQSILCFLYIWVSGSRIFYPIKQMQPKIIGGPSFIISTTLGVLYVTGKLKPIYSCLYDDNIKNGLKHTASMGCHVYTMKSTI
jgi:hypothetical protein